MHTSTANELEQPVAAGHRHSRRRLVELIERGSVFDDDDVVGAAAEGRNAIDVLWDDHEHRIHCSDDCALEPPRKCDVPGDAVDERAPAPLPAPPRGEERRIVLRHIEHDRNALLAPGGDRREREWDFPHEQQITTIPNDEVANGAAPNRIHVVRNGCNTSHRRAHRAQQHVGARLHLPLCLRCIRMRSQPRCGGDDRASHNDELVPRVGERGHHLADADVRIAREVDESDSHHASRSRASKLNHRSATCLVSSSGRSATAEGRSGLVHIRSNASARALESPAGTTSWPWLRSHSARPVSSVVTTAQP